MSVTTSKEIEVDIENVGGIDATTVPFNAGTVAFVGENATNRTSFLTALNAALGGSMANLRTDADDGYVALDIDGNKYRRTLTRAGRDAVLDGDPYCDNDDLVDLYVTLLEDNDIRTAVRNREGLRDVLMRPVDLTEIDREIGKLQEQREKLDGELARAERKAEKITTHHNQRDNKEEELEELDEELTDIRDKIAKAEADAEDIDRAEELRDKLDAKRNDLSKIEDNLQYHRSELENHNEKLEELDPTGAYEPDKEEMVDLRNKKREKQNAIDDIEDQLDTLHSLIQTAEMLDGSDNPFGVDADEVYEHVTDALTPSNGTACPLCGSETTNDAISEQVDNLKDVMSSQRAERDSLQSDVRDLQEDISRIETRINERSRVENRIKDHQEKVAHHEEQIESFEEQKQTLEADIEELEAEIEDFDLEDSNLPELYNDKSDLEYRRGRIESDIEELDAKIEDAKAAAEAVDELTERMEDTTEKIRAKRDAIETIEKELIEDFNGQMELLLDELNYDTLERVWLERLAAEDAGPHDASFELHIVREADDGAVYEDTIDTLSESEREIVGLILAVAGYEAHDVADVCPFMLLDSVESIDANRIEALLEHMSGKVETLTVALLPEDAAAVDAVTDTVSAEILG